MRKVSLAMVSACTMALCVGCSTTQRISRISPEPVAVTVRFVAPPEGGSYAYGTWQSADARLVHDGEGSLVDGGFAGDNPNSHYPAHVVLWGGGFHGDEVTYRPTHLATGPYMFGYFDPDQGSAYQGWIAVNSGGDDVLSTLNDWRRTVQEQQEWLGYDYKMDGKFECRNPKHFKQYTQELKTLRGLEKKIEQAIVAEAKYQQQQQWEWTNVFSGAEVLLMPGQGNFFSPSTRPTFNEEELSTLHDGEAVTKVVLVGNFERSFEKLNRTLDLQEDLYRNRAIFAEEAQRLENRRHYYRLTDHLYHHDKAFVENEKRFQEVRGWMASIDRQLDDYRRYCHALLFVTGLFAPDETFDAFERQQAALERERVVLNTQKQQVDWQYAQCSPTSFKRLALERQRQNCLAEIDKIDSQIEKIAETRVAVNQLRDNTEVIHRHGPAQVLAATFVGDEIPALFVNAVERESLMTVRLQAADSMFAPTSVTKVRSTFFEGEGDDFWRGPGDGQNWNGRHGQQNWNSQGGDPQWHGQPTWGGKPVRSDQGHNHDPFEPCED